MLKRNLLLLLLMYFSMIVQPQHASTIDLKDVILIDDDGDDNEFKINEEKTEE